MSGESTALSASTGQSSPGIRIDGPRVDDAARVLTPRALAFVEDLARRFTARIDELLARHRTAQARFEELGERLGVAMPSTRAVYACAKLLDEKRRTRQ